MVEISKSGSGEGSGRATDRGYSTIHFMQCMHCISMIAFHFIQGPVKLQRQTRSERDRGATPRMCDKLKD
jgi:hypothetical protein